jgi:hypothetical protein
VSIWNRRRVPLAWLRADDAASPGWSSTNDHWSCPAAAPRLERLGRAVRTGDPEFTSAPTVAASSSPVGRPWRRRPVRPRGSGRGTGDTFLVRPRTVAAPNLLRRTAAARRGRRPACRRTPARGDPRVRSGRPDQVDPSAPAPPRTTRDQAIEPSRDASPAARYPDAPGPVWDVTSTPKRSRRVCHRGSTARTLLGMGPPSD